MSSIVWKEGPQLRGLGKSIDVIGWRRFMEGMISDKVLEVQAMSVALWGCTLSLGMWAKGLIIKLMETTH